MNYKRIKKMLPDNAVAVTEIKPKHAERYSRIPPIVRTDFDEPKKKAVSRKQKAENCNLKTTK